MFKERLKKTFVSIGYWAMMLSLASAVFFLVCGIAYLVATISILGAIAKIIYFIVVVLILMTILFSACIKVSDFINWLFIEPYKNRKKGESSEEQI